MNAVPRQGYFLGKIVRGVKKFVDPAIDVVTNVAKSPVGKAALLGAGLYGLGGGFGGKFGLGNIGPSIGRGLSAAKSGLFGVAPVTDFDPGVKGLFGKMKLTGGFGSKMPTALGGITGASLLTYFMQKGATEEEAEELARDVYRGKGLGMDQIRADMKKYRSGILSASQAHDMGYHFLTPRNYLGAQGGRVGLANGSEGVKQMYVSDDLGALPKKGGGVLPEDMGKLKKENFDSEADYKRYLKRLNKKAKGGRIGYQDGSFKPFKYTSKIKEMWEEGYDETKGDQPLELLMRIGLTVGSPLIDIVRTLSKVNPTEVGRLATKAIKQGLDLNKTATDIIEEGSKDNYTQGGRIGKYGGGIGAAMPRIPTGMPRVNAGGITELDYRQEGGFVPMGVKEKADDVPAMLSKNEFVMTADAVKAAGGGDVEKGAQRMYDTMKRLEGRVA